MFNSWSKKPSNQSSRVPRASRFVRLAVEELEDRCLLNATITVNLDIDNNMRDGKLSLREAIMVSNGQLPVNMLDAPEQKQVVGNPAVGTNTIKFDFKQMATIKVTGSPLPDIIHPVEIDGGTRVVLDGAKAGNGANGFTLTINKTTASGSTIKGFTIQEFKANGIEINNTNNITIGGGECHRSQHYH